MKKVWWKESVIYQIYPRSFNDSNGDGIGDIKGIIDKLDYLKELGIDILWISPLYKSPNEDNGYDISDYYNIHSDFGTMEDFEELLKKAHEKGMKIIMDLVVNHTSSEHEWFVESRKSKNNKYRDYYIWRDGKNGIEPTNWELTFSGSAWEYDKETDMYYLHLYSSKQPDLNWENEALRKDIYKMMNWWLHKGIDGFRMDVINKISKVYPLQDVKTTSTYGRPSAYTSNGPRIHEFLKEMVSNTISNYDAMTVGEITACTIDEARKYTGDNENELNMIFQFEHMDLDYGVYGKWSKAPFDLCKLKQSFTKWQSGLKNEGWNALFWCNHDQPRIITRYFEDETYQQDIGKLLATTLHMLKGTPYIYQGEELGMSNIHFNSIEECDDIEVKNAYKKYVLTEKLMTTTEFLEGVNAHSRDHARTPMHWNTKENAGFTTGKPWIKVNPNYVSVNAENQINCSDSMLNYYKKLINLRHTFNIIVYGDYSLLLENDKNIYMYERKLNTETLLFVGNYSNTQNKLHINEKYNNGEILISNGADFNNSTVTLEPYGCIVIYKNNM